MIGEGDQEGRARRVNDQVQNGAIPTALVSAGLLRMLSLAELKMVQAICAFASYRTWRATISKEKLAKLMGVSVRTIERAQKSLVRNGVITVERGGGRGKPTTFIVSTDPAKLCFKLQDKGDEDTETPSSNVSGFAGGNPVTQGVALSSANPVKSDRKPRQNRVETPSNETVNPVTQGVAHSIDQDLNSIKGAAAEDATGAGEDGSCAALACLHGHGIGSPTAERIIEQFQGVTPGMIDEALGSLGPNAGPGLRVTTIRERLGPLLERARQRQEVCDRIRVELEKLESDLVSEYRRDPEHVDHLVDALTADERERRARGMCMVNAEELLHRLRLRDAQTIDAEVFRWGRAMQETSSAAWSMLVYRHKRLEGERLKGLRSRQAAQNKRAHQGSAA